jgi:hypothetical protein
MLSLHYSYCVFHPITRVVELLTYVAIATPLKYHFQGVDAVLESLIQHFQLLETPDQLLG